MIKMSKKDEYVRLKDYERKIKSPFMIYADFEILLLLEFLFLNYYQNFIVLFFFFSFSLI